MAEVRVHKFCGGKVVMKDCMVYGIYRCTKCEGTLRERMTELVESPNKETVKPPAQICPQ
jgi:hypothetical protein